MEARFRAQSSDALAKLKSRTYCDEFLYFVPAEYYFSLT